MSSGKRPFGVSLLYMGWDKHYGFQLYQSDPSGNYGGWKATCIGNNSAVSQCYHIMWPKKCSVIFNKEKAYPIDPLLSFTSSATPHNENFIMTQLSLLMMA